MVEEGINSLLKMEIMPGYIVELDTKRATLEQRRNFNREFDVYTLASELSKMGYTANIAYGDLWTKEEVKIDHLVQLSSDPIFRFPLQIIR